MTMVLIILKLILIYFLQFSNQLYIYAAVSVLVTGTDGLVRIDQLSLLGTVPKWCVFSLKDFKSLYCSITFEFVTPHILFYLTNHFPHSLYFT